VVKDIDNNEFSAVSVIDADEKAGEPEKTLADIPKFDGAAGGLEAMAFEALRHKIVCENMEDSF